MGTVIAKNTTYNPVKGWLFFLPIYAFLIVIAYYVTDTFFMKTVDADKYFGISFSKEQIFNKLLFTHLSIAVAAIALIHFISAITGIRFTIGRYLLAGMLIIALLLFILGINIPLIKTTKFYFIKENYSLIDVLDNLKNKNEILLYWVMLVFTFVVPLLKMIGLSSQIYFTQGGTAKTRIISLLSKWAMVDVLVLAVLISTMKSGSGLVEMSSSSGISYFVASLFISLIITSVLPFLSSK